jgi:SNF2 family DNA or RNA helicase
MFSTAIFYEIEWSLAILWQAMRRIYRPGAPLPVRVIFPAYAGTLCDFRRNCRKAGFSNITVEKVMKRVSGFPAQL